jgi:fatty-acyl-CoA synthase
VRRGASLHSINTRLAIIAFQLDHAMSKIVIVVSSLYPLMQEALALAAVSRW